MRFSARHLRIALRCVLALAVLGGGLLLGAGLFLRHNPEALAQRLSDAIQTRTGLACSINIVDVVMLPVPALALVDVRLEGDWGEFSVAYATVRPSFTALLTGSFEPGDITLLRPDLRLRLPDATELPSPATPTPSSPAPKLALLLKNLRWPDLPALPEMLDGCRLRLLHGALEVRYGDDNLLLLEDLRTDLRAGKPDALRGWVSLGTARLFEKNTLRGALEALHIDVNASLSQLRDGKDASLRLTTRVHAPSLTPTARVQVTFDQNENAAGTPSQRLRLDSSGDMLRDGVSIPFSLRGIADNTAQQGPRIRTLQLTLGQDSLTLEGVLHAAANPPDFTGSIQVQRLSLGRWFGFARRLPPGLQRSLDDLSGSLTFTATPQGLTVSNLQAVAAGSAFTGNGGVENWSSPVVALNLAAPAVDLNTVLPEAAGREVSPPDYGHTPLTPELGTSSGPDSGPDVGYDIRLRTDSLDYAGLALGTTRFRCRPNADDDALLTFAVKNVYGGTLDSEVIMRDATHAAIKGTLKDVAAERPLTVLTGKAWAGGRLNAAVDVSAQGRTLATFLSTLKGSVSLRLEDGFLRQTPGSDGKGHKFSFTRLELAAQASSLAPATSGTPASYRYDGTWQGNLNATDFRVSAKLDGPVTFASKILPLQLHKLAGTVSLQLNKQLTGLQEDVKTDVTGKFSFHTGSNTLQVEDARASALGMEASGSIKADLLPQGTDFKGRLTLKTANLRQSLLRIGTSASSLPANMPRTVELSGDVELNKTSLTLDNLKGTLDATAWSGHISGNWKQRPTWKFNLTADALNLDEYRSPPVPATSKPQPPTAPWKLSLLHTFDAQGMLRCSNLRLRKLTFADVRLPVRLQKGILDCAPVTANLYGAKGIWSLRGESGEQLKIQATMEASGVDMLRLTQDLGLKNVLAGRTSLGAKVRGSLRNAADIPAALDGTWRVELRDGFLQSRNSRGQLSGSRTNISVANVSGTMEKGVLRTSDLVMEGNNLHVTGSGWIDLAAETLDLTLRVNMFKVPEFPIRFHGNLSHPQSSIQAGQALVKTLGNLGAGLLDVVGGALGGAMRLLSR